MSAKNLLTIAAILLIGWTMFSVVSEIVGGEWSTAPEMSSLSAAARRIGLPEGVAQPDVETFSKVTFSGATYRAHTRLSSTETEAFYLDQGKRLEWNLVEKKNHPHRTNIIFCDGNYSIVIELASVRRATNLRVGVYWTALRNDDRYCRQGRPG